MPEIKKTDIEKVVSALRKSSRKFLSLEGLSSLIGLYPDVLGSELAFFNPTIMMDPSVNVKDLLPTLEAYLAEKENASAKRPKRVVATAKDLNEYSSVADFAYKRLTTAGGLIDSSIRLSDHDLRVLQKLVAKEVKSRKSSSKKGK
jgi:hypothetical protein